MSRINEPEERLDALTTQILPPMRAAKYVDRNAAKPARERLNQ
jgi:hypothetical protein